MEERIFKRKFYEKMLAWKRDNDGRTALMIKGARRVGKSTIAEEFAKNEYESYILVDFTKVGPASLFWTRFRSAPKPARPLRNWSKTIGTIILRQGPLSASAAKRRESVSPARKHV